MESNLQEVVDKVVVKMEGFKTPNKMLRAMALATLGSMHRRIHNDGLASDGAPIGQYSKGYLAVRSGNYRNATRWKKGSKAGQHKDQKKQGESGVHTKGRTQGVARPVYNRGTDPKVILSLTRQMENDMKVTATANGYTLGYSNPTNMQKARWAEDTYNKPIFSLSKEEEENIRVIAQSYVKEELK